MTYYEDADDHQREAQLLQSDDDDNGTTSNSGNINIPRPTGTDAATAARGPIDPSGHYKALGVATDATQQEIRKAFLHLSQRYHTDKHSDQVQEMQDAMTDRFQQLQDAYTLLSDEKQRAAYDAAGKKGADRLALVPAGLSSRKDIIGYINSLDREAHLLKTARMLSATSDVTLHYSTAGIFMTPATQQEVLAAAAAAGGPELPSALTGAGASVGAATSAAAPGVTAAAAAAHDQDAAAASAADGVTTKKPPSNNLGTIGVGSSSSGGSEKSKSAGKPEAAAAKPPVSTTTTTAPGAATATAEASAAAGTVTSTGTGTTVEARMTAKEIEINGKKVIVFIPPEEMQNQIREKIAKAGGGTGGSAAGTATAAAGAVDGGDRLARALGLGGTRIVNGQRVNLLTAMIVSAVPTSIVFRHTFQHALTSRAVLLFQTDARSEAGRAQVSMTASAEFQQDPCNTWVAVLRTTIGGLKFTVFKERVLSPLHTLRSKLTCFNAGQLLQKLELSLTRKLSQTTEMTNTIAWSLNERGFFSSRIAQAWETGSQGCSAYLSYHGMTLTAFTASSVTYGVDTGDPRHAPARGRIEYTVNCSPLSGQTQAGFAAWYYHAPLQHYGIGFVTVLPYSFSPIAPPLFFVESSQYAVVNQVSLLYGRGKHRISVPIIVFISPRISQALTWVSVPLVAFRVARMVYRPYAKAIAARHYNRVRREHLPEMDIAREKASLEQRALETMVMVSRASEDRRGGLVIINARYGVLAPEYAAVTSTAAAEEGTVSSDNGADDTDVSRPPTPPPATTPRPFSPRGGGGSSGLPRPGPQPSPSPQPQTSNTKKGKKRKKTGAGKPPLMTRIVEWFLRRHDARTAQQQQEGVSGGVTEDIPLSIDVSIALQNLVRDSALVLPGGTKCTLVGFCDPDPHTPELKQLKVTYWFRKKKHTAVFDDDEAVVLPQREHRTE